MIRYFEKALGQRLQGLFQLWQFSMRGLLARCVQNADEALGGSQRLDRIRLSRISVLIMPAIVGVQSRLDEGNP